MFEHEGLARTVGTTIYEERIIVLRAVSLEEAIEKGEAEARKYISGSGIRCTGFIDVFHLFGPKLRDGTEVYSLMRESALPIDTYLNQFYDDGNERSQRWQPDSDSVIDPGVQPPAPQRI